MRRVSQKAANKLRGRGSSVSSEHDERSGPLLMRTRSGSASGENLLETQPYETLEDDDDVNHDFAQLDLLDMLV